MPYVVKRLVAGVGVLLGVSLVAFILMHAAPGDPAAILMDPQISAEDMAQFRENLGLDRPILVQYWVWLSQMLQGDFGRSFVTGEPVLLAIGARMPATLVLSVSSLVLIVTLTFGLGILSAVNKGRWIDNVIVVLTFLGLSIPTFWLGLVLILGFSIYLGWFPTSGYMDPGVMGFWAQVRSIGWHMVLPLATIVGGGLAGLTRYNRSGVLGILSQPYILAARARGIPSWRVLCLHVFKNAALPVVTILGLSLPGLISGSFIIEYIFAWPGMGQLGISAVFSRDYPVLMGTLMMSSVLIVMGTLVSDLVYRVVDPRISKR